MIAAANKGVALGAFSDVVGLPVVWLRVRSYRLLRWASLFVTGRLLKEGERLRKEIKLRCSG